MPRSLSLFLSILLIFSSSIHLFAQQPDTLIKKLDSLRIKTDSVGQINVINKDAYNQTTAITPRAYFILLGSNFKQQATKPFHMNGHDWRNVGIGALVIGAFGFSDEPVQKYVLDLRNRNPSIGKVSKFVTNTGGPYEVITLSLMAGYGIIFKKEKFKTTSLLASQSYITSGVFMTLIKGLTGRQRPFVYHPNQVEAEPKFHGPFHSPFVDINGKKIGSSFPSGHTAGAFAAATVFAKEYRNKPWVKVLAYGSASLIGASRITENKHWVSDVLAGAALGFFSGNQVVNNYHRYATLQNEKRKKGSVTFNLNFDMGVLMPSVIYTFR